MKHRHIPSHPQSPISRRTTGVRWGGVWGEAVQGWAEAEGWPSAVPCPAVLSLEGLHCPRPLRPIIDRARLCWPIRRSGHSGAFVHSQSSTHTNVAAAPQRLRETTLAPAIPRPSDSASTLHPHFLLHLHLLSSAGRGSRRLPSTPRQLSGRCRPPPLLRWACHPPCPPLPSQPMRTPAPPAPQCPHYRLARQLPPLPPRLASTPSFPFSPPTLCRTRSCCPAINRRAMTETPSQRRWKS